MKTVFTAKELTAILILELKVWSDNQSELSECLSNRNAVEDSCGLTTSFDSLTSRAHYFADFSCESEDGEGMEEYGAEAHTADYLASVDEEKKMEALIKAKIILKEEEELVANLSEDVVISYAEQKVCVEDAPNAFSYGEQNETVTLLLKRLSNKGHWYTLTKDQDEYAPEFEIKMNVHDIFDVNGNSLTLKMYGNKTSLEMIFAKYDLDDEYLYSYVDQKSGEMVFKSQAQAFQIKGSFFKAGMTVEGKRLEATVHHFLNAVDDNGEVFQCLSYYGHQNLTECGRHLLIIPSTVDESNGDAAESDFNEGIMYGTSQATRAMMSDDLTDDAIREIKKEEARQKREGKRMRRAMLTKRDVKVSKDQILLNSALGSVVKELSELSYKAIKSRKAELDAHKILAGQSDLEKLKDVCEAYKRINGKCLDNKMWKTLSSMITIQKNKKFAESVESHILENIANINNGSLDIADIDDETLVEIRLASMNHGWDKEAKKPTLAWIHGAEKSNAIKARYQAITGTAGAAPANPRNSQVRKIKVVA